MTDEVYDQERTEDGQTETERQAQDIETTREARVEAAESVVVEKLKRGDTIFSESELECIADKFGVDPAETPFGVVHTAEDSPHRGTVAPQRAVSPEDAQVHDAEGNELDVDEDGFTEQARAARDREQTQSRAPQDKVEATGISTQ